MRRLITLTLTVLLVGLFAAVVFAAVEAGDDPAAPAGTTEATETTTEATETTTTPDERGDDQPAAGNGAAPQPGVDISGPCDEAEHANDPRCTGGGVAAGEDDDDRGRDREDRGDRGDDDRGDDDHGRVDNSGPGSVNSGRDDDDDHLGSGHGGDDWDDDDSGDDDSSGRGRGRGGDDD